MVSVICPCTECKHNGKRYRCKCKEIKLEWRNMATVNEGRVDMWVCHQYEQTDQAKEIEEEIKKGMYARWMN